MSKISFICPIFNKKEYLDKVLKSIKNQVGDFDKEYIFINDGSTDGSLEFLKQYTKKWNNLRIINQPNQGPAIATQIGISYAKGDYVKLVGGDDVMSPFCCNILLETIRREQSVAAFSSYKLLKDYKNIKFGEKKIINYRSIENPILETVKSSFSGTTPNLYCNKSIKKSGGCNMKIFIEDFSLVLGLAKIGKFCFIDNITSYGPRDDNKRIMVGKKIQLIHDYNAALYYFIKENSQINKTILKLACKKSLGRSDKWFRREYGKTKLNKMNYYKLCVYFGRKDYLNLIRESCLFFYKHSEDKSIRYKISHSP